MYGNMAFIRPRALRGVTTSERLQLDHKHTRSGSKPRACDITRNHGLIFDHQNT